MGNEAALNNSAIISNLFIRWLYGPVNVKVKGGGPVRILLYWSRR